MLPEGRIKMAHGAGGRLMANLIEEIFVKKFGSERLKELDDSAVLNLDGTKKIAFTTDAFIVKPHFFPGGDIGKIAVCGTVNDLAVQGADPKFISVSMIIEEGYPISNLVKIADSIKKWSDVAGTEIVTGDTKVVEKGVADGIYISTSGIGLINLEINFFQEAIAPGDSVIVSGTIGDHGMTILAKRNGFKVGKALKSDCAPLNLLTRDMSPFAGEIKWMRDITRGGLASCLNELAESKSPQIEIEEAQLPISEGASAVAEFLGVDPLVSASEGKMVMIVKKEAEEKLMKALKKNPLGDKASIIGRVKSINSESSGRVILKTKIGSSRIVNMPSGELIPRIC